MQNYSQPISEVEAQHHVLINTVASLQEILMQPDQQHRIRAALSDLRRLLIAHYAYEESLMDLAGCQDAWRHRQLNEETIRLFDYFFRYPSSPTGDARFGNSVTWKVLGHVADDDAHHAIEECQRSLAGATARRLAN